MDPSSKLALDLSLCFTLTSWQSRANRRLSFGGISGQQKFTFVLGEEMASTSASGEQDDAEFRAFEAQPRPVRAGR
jgi:hypothetical protein